MFACVSNMGNREIVSLKIIQEKKEKKQQVKRIGKKLINQKRIDNLTLCMLCSLKLNFIKSSFVFEAKLDPK